MRTTAALRIVGAVNQTAARVTELLQLTPTSIVEAGDARSERRPNLVAEVPVWVFEATHVAEDVTLGESLNFLLDQVEHLAPKLWQLEEEGYVLDWFSFVGCYAAEEVTLDRDTMRRLLDLPGELTLDIYPEELDDDEYDAPTPERHLYLVTT